MNRGMFSRRTDHTREPNELARAVAEARARGRELIDLTVANPTACGLGLDGESTLAPLANPGALRYEPAPLGRLTTRERVAAEFGVATASVALTASTSEAYAHVFALLADPGDHILVPRPSYPLLDWLARFTDVTLHPYELGFDGDWYYDVAAIERALSERTRAVVVVTPNNPTGSVLTPDARDQLLALGRPLIIDEVFARYPLDLEAAPSLPPASSGLEFRLSGLSKQVALPQMKLGFISVTGEEPLVMEAMARLSLVSDTFLSTSAPIELAAPAWLDRGDEVRAAIRERCRANLRALDACLGGTAATRLRTDAGWYVVVRVPQLYDQACDEDRDEDRYCAALLQRGVVVQPGWYFDFPTPAFLVLSLLPEEATFARGIAVLAEVVRLMSAGPLA